MNQLLYLVVTTERPVQVKVVKVKKSDKGDFYKRQQTWELRDLTTVDAKDASKVSDYRVFQSVCVLIPPPPLTVRTNASSA